MADEISATVSLQVRNGTLQLPMLSKSGTFNQTTVGGYNPGHKVVGTVEETVAFGDITPKWVWLQNLDSVNSADYGPATGSYLCRISPGAVHLIELMPGAVLYMKANTAEVALYIAGVNT